MGAGFLETIFQRRRINPETEWGLPLLRRPTTRFGHVDVHREYLPRVLLGALAGNAEVRAFALSMGRNEIIAWISSLLVGIALMSAGIIALLESF
jgi:hypothetical protein